MDTRLDKLIELAKDFYQNGDPGHDFAHVLRVMETARDFAVKLGAEQNILLPATLLHDVVNLPKDHPERKQASSYAAKKASEILQQLGFSEAEISRVTLVILEHSYSLGKTPTSLESEILQDADRLDALGAVGVMRTVSCGARMGAAYYHLDEPFAEKRELDDRRYTVDHFFNKLLKLSETMNTEPGRCEAQKRTVFMQEFLAQLKSEIQPRI